MVGFLGCAILMKRKKDCIFYNQIKIDKSKMFKSKILSQHYHSKQSMLNFKVNQLYFCLSKHNGVLEIEVLIC